MWNFKWITVVLKIVKKDKKNKWGFENDRNKILTEIFVRKFEWKVGVIKEKMMWMIFVDEI